MTEYEAFLEQKRQLDGDHGFDPVWMPDFLFPFQAALVEWALRKGRGALFTECGTGKTAMQLAWADEVARHTNGRVLILTPLAVAQQTAREAEKFGIAARHSRDGSLGSDRIVIANYERLHYFDPIDFAGVVCDESSCLKNAKSVTKAAVTGFARKMPYRLLATATPAPNDYIELGTSSEALGYLGFKDMLNRFFKNDQNTSETGRMHGKGATWRFKKYSEEFFWRWLASWSRAMRKPSDFGFSDAGYDLPPLTYREHVVAARATPPGMLFTMPAVGFVEVRQERRCTIQERADKVAELVNDTGQPAIVWCQLNDEGDALERLIPDAVQISGRDSDDTKEAKLTGFATGDIRVLVSKPVIGAWGLNLQHCNHIVIFPDYSFEQHYQAVRRCWRFGQEREVAVDVVATEGQAGVREILARKNAQFDRMFESLTKHMNDALHLNRRGAAHLEAQLPAWLNNAEHMGKVA